MLTERELRKRIAFWKKREVPAVLNSSPCIYLTKIGALPIVFKLYENVYISPKVKWEVIDRGKEKEQPDAYIIEKYVNEGLIKIKEVKNQALCKLLAKTPFIHYADAEAVVLAEELKAVLIMDDTKAIEIAKLRAVIVEPTLTVILIAYAVDALSYERTKALCKELLKTRFRVGAEDYERTLWYLETIRKIK